MSDDDPIQRLEAEYAPKERMSLAFACLDRARIDGVELARQSSSGVPGSPDNIVGRATSYYSFMQVCIDGAFEDDDEL